MKISHNDAIILEAIVRKVHDCDRASMGGYIDAGHYESDPFDAALIAIAPLWKRGYAREVEAFLFKWDEFFRGDSDCQQLSVDTYIDELDDLIDKLLSA